MPAMPGCCKTQCKWRIPDGAVSRDKSSLRVGVQLNSEKQQVMPAKSVVSASSAVRFEPSLFGNAARVSYQVRLLSVSCIEVTGAKLNSGAK